MVRLKKGETAIQNSNNSYGLFVSKLVLLGNKDAQSVTEWFLTRLLSGAVQIYWVVEENKVVFADEMDRVLSPVLSDRVIAYINGCEHNGQFIFSTHNVLHLDLERYNQKELMPFGVSLIC